MAHHIDTLKIRAFRRLRNVELPDLARVNLFVGENNTGKTSVLEAVSLHCRPLDPLSWFATARRYEINSSHTLAFDAFRWLFPQRDASYEDDHFIGQVQIEGSGGFQCVESGGSYRGIVAAEEDADDPTVDANGESSGSSSLTYSRRRGADVAIYADQAPGKRRVHQFQLWEDKPLVETTGAAEPLLNVAFVSPFAHRIESFQVGQLSRAIQKGEKADVLDIMRLLDPEIEDIEVLAPQGTRASIHVRHRATGYTPLITLGDGVRRVLGFAVALHSARGGVLLIDEVETAIHKDALSKVFRWLTTACARYDVQLFATTHSLDAVDAFVGAKHVDFAEVAGYRLERDAESVTVRPMPGELLHRLRYERALDVR